MATPLEEPITNAIREAIMNHTHRDSQLSEIQDSLLVSRQTAKQMFYAFLYFPEETHLESFLIHDALSW